MSTASTSRMSPVYGEVGSTVLSLRRPVIDPDGAPRRVISAFPHVTRRVSCIR